MSKIHLPIFILFLIALSYCHQEVPLRKGEYGFSVGDKHGSLHIEFFMDFLCPDSRASYFNLTDVRKAIDFNQQSIRLTYQFIPLSFHFYAFKVHQAFFYVLQKVGQPQAEKFIDYVFTTQDNWAEEKWLDRSTSQFLDEFVNAISSVIKLDKAQFRASLNSYDTWNTARYHWKYSVGQNFVSGAPLFNINSVRGDGLDDYTTTQWINLIKQYRATGNIRIQKQVNLASQ